MRQPGQVKKVSISKFFGDVCSQKDGRLDKKRSIIEDLMLDTTKAILKHAKRTTKRDCLPTLVSQLRRSELRPLNAKIPLATMKLAHKRTPPCPLPHRDPERSSKTGYALV